MTEYTIKRETNGIGGTRFALHAETDKGNLIRGWIHEELRPLALAIKLLFDRGEETNAEIIVERGLQNVEVKSDS